MEIRILIDKSTIEQLDIVLKFLATSQFAKGGLPDAEIFSQLQKIYPESQSKDDFGSHIVRIVDKLVKDEYV